MFRDLRYFVKVAAVNHWDGEAMLLWLRVGFTGRAQKAFNRKLQQIVTPEHQRH